MSTLQMVPVNEPDRQYYFIDKARTYVRQLGEALGRTPRACITTFGCQMNTVSKI
ncbi:hypothetical protein LJC51_07545 [Lachnospiraceae bacterium OttesenSCG-928-J05]|nr:hypothetical protein [Lachnospiraceae bacterium OttesenSCG-928-J05]